MDEDDARLGRLLPRYAGDWRSLIPGPSAGIMQLMHPAIGQAVLDHSEFVRDPLGRVHRSVPQIWAVVLSNDGEARARRIRDLHRAIAGYLPGDAAGSSGGLYRALDVETFWWAHATFTWEIFRSIELFHPRQLDRTRAEQLYQDTVGWYRMYGMAMRPVPPDLESFWSRFAAVCQDVLKMTDAARLSLDMTRGSEGAKSTASALSKVVPQVPQRLVRLAVRVTHSSGRLGLVGCMPALLRERFPDELSMTRLEKARFAVARGAIAGGFTALPQSLNRSSMKLYLRAVGRQTRPQRYVPPDSDRRSANHELSSSEVSSSSTPAVTGTS